jgi:CheY-like chemotaxis protein
MSEPTGVEPTAADAASAVPTPARPRVLVADDEAGTRALMAEILTHGGFEVVQARDGIEALVRAREAPPDLALLDVMMPGLDGREVCRRLRGDPALAHVPVVLHSAADEDSVDWQGAGADAFLAKPFALRELPDRLRRHLVLRTAAEAPQPRRLTDAEIRQIALALRKAVRRPPPYNQAYAITSPYAQLSDEDETRVEAALLALLSSSRGPTPHPTRDAADAGGVDPTRDDGRRDDPRP